MSSWNKTQRLKI